MMRGMLHAVSHGDTGIPTHQKARHGPQHTQPPLSPTSVAGLHDKDVLAFWHWYLGPSWQTSLLPPNGEAQHFGATAPPCRQPRVTFPCPVPSSCPHCHACLPSPPRCSPPQDFFSFGLKSSAGKPKPKKGDKYNKLRDQRARALSM